MIKQISIKRLTIGETGNFTVETTDGQAIEFASVEKARNFASEVFNEPKVLLQLGAARYFRLDPNVATPQIIEGSTVTLTDDSPNMITTSL